MEQQQGHCISLFLPTHQAGEETQQDSLRLSHQLRAVENRLLLKNLRPTQVQALLEPIQALLDDEQCWLYRSSGLAVFRSPELFRTYWLPYPFKEQVIVTGHFYLKPLLPFMATDGRFSILALSQKERRRAREEAVASYRAYAGSERVSNDLRAIIPAAYYGRIEHLFLAVDQEQWGTFNPATNTLHVHREPRFQDDELLDMAATQTLLHGGSVYVVEQAQMPGEGLLAAVFRY